MAESKKKDPTVTSEIAGPSYPEGTHPPRQASETEHGQPREYRDNPDKPDPTSIAQVEVRPDEKA